MDAGAKRPIGSNPWDAQAVRLPSSAATRVNTTTTKNVVVTAAYGAEPPLLSGSEAGQAPRTPPPERRRVTFARDTKPERPITLQLEASQKEAYERYMRLYGGENEKVASGASQRDAYKRFMDQYGDKKGKVAQSQQQTTSSEVIDRHPKVKEFREQHYQKILEKLGEVTNDIPSAVNQLNQSVDLIIDLPPETQNLMDIFNMAKDKKHMRTVAIGIATTQVALENDETRLIKPIKDYLIERLST